MITTNNETDIHQTLLTTKQVAALLNVSEKVIERHRSRMPGVLKVMFGKRPLYRFNPAELHRAISTGRLVLSDRLRK